MYSFEIFSASFWFAEGITYLQKICDSNRNNKEQIQFRGYYNKKLEKYGNFFYLEKKNNKEIKFDKYVII